jgi:hypothetical protein
MLYQLGFKQIPAVPLEFGSYVHEAISALIKVQVRGDKPDIEAVARSLLPRYSLLTEEHKGEAMGILENWRIAFDPTMYTNVVTEIRTVIPVGQDVNVVTKRDFRGVLKVNPEIVQVIDWKSGWKNDPEPYGPQVAMYLWPTQQEYPDRTVEGYLWWLRYKRSAKIQVDVDPEEGKAWALGIMGRIEEAKKLPAGMGFPATPGGACRLCGVSWACLGGVVPQEIASESEARDVAAFALQLDSALAICKDVMKRYVKDHGAIEVGGEYWGDFPKVSWKFEDIPAFKELLEKAGLDPWEFLAVDGFKLKKLWKIGFAAKLEAMGEKKVGTYFAHRSQPPEQAAGEAE